jgi:hypothetical protein
MIPLSRIRLGLVVAVITAATSVLTPVAASASAAPATHSAVRADSEADAQTSPTWSGYETYAPPATYNEVEASWVQPKADCSKGDGKAVFWIGLDGWWDSTVEQTGSEAVCAGGTPTYSAWWEIYPNNEITSYADPVNAGDHFFARVTSVGNNQYELLLEDTTKHWSEDKDVAGPSGGTANNSAEIIVETPTLDDGSYANLPDFGSVTFTGVKVDSEPIGSFAENGAINMVRKNGDVLDTTSALSNENAFTTIWKALS